VRSGVSKEVLVGGYSRFVSIVVSAVAASEGSRGVFVAPIILLLLLHHHHGLSFSLWYFPSADFHVVAIRFRIHTHSEVLILVVVVVDVMIASEVDTRLLLVLETNIPFPLLSHRTGTSR